MIKHRLLVAAAVAVSTGLTAFAQQTPSKPAPPKTAAAPATKMPAAVQAAFTKAYPNAAVKHVSKETEDGKTVYEVESVDAGKRRDINYNPDGTVILYEEELTAADIPALVTTAITARYPKATITARERLYTIKDGTANYEFGIKGVTGVTEVILTPAGTWVSPKAK